LSAIAVAIHGLTHHGVNGEALQNEQLSWPIGGCHDRFTYFAPQAVVSRASLPKLA
jgi:hypothetical protein